MDKIEFRRAFPGFADELTEAFCSSAAYAYEITHDFDRSVEWALVNTPINIPIPDDPVARIDSFFTTGPPDPGLVGAFRDALTAPQTRFDVLRATADIPTRVRQLQYDVFREAIINAVAALGDLPAARFGPLVAEVFVGSPPLLLEQGSEAPKGKREPSEPEAPPEDPEQEQKDKETVPLVISGGAEEVAKFLREHPKLEALAEIILGACGIEGILELATTDARFLEIMAELQKAIKAKDVKKIEKILSVLIRYILSKGFRRKLKDKFGVKGLKRLLAKLLGRAVPVVGWLILIGSLIGLIWVKWDKLMDP